MLVWDSSRPGSAPVTLGCQDDVVAAMAVLPDGRVVSGGAHGRVLVWDPARPGGEPIELGRHSGWVNAVVALPHGWVASAGNDRRVLIWNATTQSEVAQLACSAIGLAAVQAKQQLKGSATNPWRWPGRLRWVTGVTSGGLLSRSEASLLVGHAGHGFSLWSITKGPQ